MPAGIAAIGLKAIGADTPGGISSGLFVPESSASPLVLLLRHIRQTIQTTLPEITEIPETMDAFPTDSVTKRLNCPFLVMLGKTPRPGDAAVTDETQILTFDFVYVIESVKSGITDVQEYVRDRLVYLKRALLADYRQGGFANATRLVQDPIDHTNKYKLIFAQEAQPVTALELVMEFDIIESRLVG